ncbi:alpha-1,6-glucosidase domain-containing protein [Piscinibacterium candidicorallinum]|uniref:Alpha-1,6-glucosidase domain-containing protein n=1 Tax=Piscinibacterium candidicorallinum TaxID=1793872 RepID=A0ABV7H2R2_9BURK
MTPFRILACGALAALLPLAAAVAQTAAAPLPPVDCNFAGHQQVLAAAPAEAPKLAREAYWLNGFLLQWPGAKPAAGTTFKLLSSARGAVVARTGGVPEGVEASIDLTPRSQSLPAGVSERFKWIGAGPVLEVKPADRSRIKPLLRGQVVLAALDAEGKVVAATLTQMPGALDALYSQAERVPDLGANLREGATHFKLWAPTAQAVSVCLYDTGSGNARSVHPMRMDLPTGVWASRLPTNHSGRYFRYAVDVIVDGVGLVRNHVTDPYALSFTTDSVRAYIADLDDARLKPAGWDSTPRPTKVRNQTDMVIYELHVRDFSITDATVPEKLRGTFAAFTQTGSNGMKHLAALSQAGLTDVHLLPAFDIATIPEKGCVSPQIPQAGPGSEAQQAAIEAVSGRDCFNWGYDPFNFTAPEGSYSTDASDGARRIIEFREMVQALHRIGLRVGMDVVYNHTPASGQSDKSVLDRIVPGYYQRLNAKGAVEQSTCCENTATEHMMMAKLMIESAVVWARDYKIDSFRFDLMGHQPRPAMEQLQRAVNRATGRNINLIGEGWNFGEIENGRRFVQASQLSLNGSGIGTFSDRARDAARGGGCCDSGEALLRQGWINGLVYAPNESAQRAPFPETELMAAADLIRVGLAGSLRGYRMTTADGVELKLEEIPYGNQPAGYASQPGEVVNYVENHDNHTLFDINALKMPADTPREERARAQIVGAAITAFSQGVAYFHAGVETLRSKSLDKNSYDSGDWFNRIDWTLTDNYFGTGLPPKRDNGHSWAVYKPVLENPLIKPTAAEIQWTNRAFQDLLKIRASSALFRLPTAQAVSERLRLLNTGPTQNPVLLAGHLNGEGLSGAGGAGANFRQLLYVINASPQAQTLDLPADLRNAAWVLHPVHREAGADARVANDARTLPGGAALAIPGRSAVVFVIQ